MSVKRGDTLLEVVFAFVIFSLVSAIAVTVMNSSISSAEAALELSLARTEIDAQSEVIRFIQSSYAYDRTYKILWDAITKRALGNTDRGENETNYVPELAVSRCSELYDDMADKNIYRAKAFALNTRKIVSGNDSSDPANYYTETLIEAESDAVSNKFFASTLNPRIVYTNSAYNSEGTPITTDDILQEDSASDRPVFNQVARVEGLYDVIIKDTDHNDPYFYDVYINTCWYAPGAERPTTIGTVMRIFNPEFNHS